MTTAVLLLALIVVKRAAAEGFSWFPWHRDASQAPAPARQDDDSGDPNATAPAQVHHASLIATTKPTDGAGAADGRLQSYTPGNPSAATLNANSTQSAPTTTARRSFVDKLLRRPGPRRTAWEFWDQERPEGR